MGVRARHWALAWALSLSAPLLHAESEMPMASAPDSGAEAEGAAPAREEDPVLRFAAATELLAAGHGPEALAAYKTLSEDAPQFQLGQQFYQQLRTRLKDEVRVGTYEVLAREARLRLSSETAVPPPGTVPDVLLQLADHIQHAIVVNLSSARLYVLENDKGQLKLLRNQYAGMGSNGYGKQLPGDRRTPLGVYQITGWIAGDKLPPLYGSGAFPLDYPNVWDQFRLRGGHGIWLHGVPPGMDTRPPQSSEGCVTMANADLLALKPYITPGATPVVLSDAVNWVTPDTLASEREAVLSRLEAWRQAWSAIDTDAYLGFYAEDFSTPDMSRDAFAAYKQRVNAQKQDIDVQLDELSVYRYPDPDARMMLAEFSQHYRSDNYRSDSRKLQFWRQDSDGQWRIVREETR